MRLFSFGASQTKFLSSNSASVLSFLISISMAEAIFGQLFPVRAGVLVCGLGFLHAALMVR